MTIRLSVVELSHLEKILNSKDFNQLIICSPHKRTYNKWEIFLLDINATYRFNQDSLEEVIKEISLFIAEREKDDYFGKRA